MTLKEIELLSFNDEAINLVDEIVDYYKILRNNCFTKSDREDTKESIRECFEDLQVALETAEKRKAEHDAEQTKHNSGFSEEEIQTILEVIKNYVYYELDAFSFMTNPDFAIGKPKTTKNKFSIYFTGRLKTQLGFAEKNGVENIAKFVYEKCRDICSGASFEDGVLTLRK